MNKPRPFFYCLCCIVVLPCGQAIAQDIKIEPCSFNGGQRQESASASNKGLVLYNPSNGNKTICVRAQNTGALCSITENGIGPVKLGMTLLDAKQAFPMATFSRGSDGEGVALVNVTTKESLVMVLFAGDIDRDKPIDWSKRISFMETFSPKCATRLGVHPGSLVSDTERLYGKIQKIVRSEIESRQYARFKNQPRGMIFRIDYSGVFQEGQPETIRYRPDAHVSSIAIEAR